MLNKQALNLIKVSEALSLKPYRDPGRGVATIGYGNTFYENGKKVSLLDPAITEDRANELFNNIVTAFSLKVKGLVKVSINSNQLGALTSLAYNIGMEEFRTSTVLRLVNENPNNPLIEEAFSRFKYSGGKVLNGLIKRRAKEYALYNKFSFNVKIILPLLLFLYTVLVVTV